MKSIRNVQIECCPKFECPKRDTFIHYLNVNSRCNTSAYPHLCYPVGFAHRIRLYHSYRKLRVPFRRHLLILPSLVNVRLPFFRFFLQLTLSYHFPPCSRQVPRHNVMSIALFLIFRRTLPLLPSLGARH